MEVCDHCGVEYYAVWRAPDVLWKRLSGRTDGSGLLCMACFEEAALQGNIALYWECAEGLFPSEKGGITPCT